MTDDDILKTLLRIEKLLGGAATTVVPRVPTNIAGGAGRRPALNDKKAEAEKQKTYKATVTNFSSLNDAAIGLGKTFGGLSRTVTNTRSRFVELNRTMRASSKGTAVAKEEADRPREEADRSKPRGFLENLFSSMGAKSTKTGVDEAGKSIISFGKKFDYIKAGLTSFGVMISKALVPAFHDFYALQAAGIDASSSLAGLYVDAGKAGMSLKEYTAVLMESSVAVTRASSMDAFNKTLQSSNDRLAGLGIFGEEATKLSASLATSATTLGIPQEQLAKAMVDQVDVFGQLRKSSLMTAEQFRALTADLAENQEVQSQLLGMDKNDRAARFTELTQLESIGLSMGSTTKASKALGDALIDQRKLLAPQRFEAAGQIRQAGAILGMDTGDTETLAGLAQKKKLTPEEGATAARLAGQLQESVDRLASTGDIQQENVAEQLQQMFQKSGIDRLLTAAGNVRLTEQSGPAGVNKNFSTGVEGMLKWVGQANAWLEGIKKNSIVEGVVGAIGSAAFSTGLGNVIGSSLGNILPRLFGRGAAALSAEAAGAGAASIAEGAAGAAAAGTAADKAATATSGVAKVLGTVATALPAVINAASSLSDLTDAQKKKAAATSPEELASAKEDEKKAAGAGVGGTVGAAVGIIISGFVDAFTLGTFTITNGIIIAATTWLGSKLGSWFMSDSPTNKALKDNADKTKDNTDAVKKSSALLQGTTVGVLTSSDNLTNRIEQSAKTLRDAGLTTAAQEPPLTEPEKSKIREQAYTEMSGPMSGDAANTADVEQRYQDLLAQAQLGRAAAAPIVAPAAAPIVAPAPAPIIATPAAPIVAPAPAPIIATPAPSPVVTVTQPAGTPEDVAAAAATAAVSNLPAPPAPALPDAVATQLGTMIELLRQMLTAEQLQAAGLDELVRAAGRPTFTDQAESFQRILQN